MKIPGVIASKKTIFIGIATLLVTGGVVGATVMQSEPVVEEKMETVEEVVEVMPEETTPQEEVKEEVVSTEAPAPTQAVTPATPPPSQESQPTPMWVVGSFPEGVDRCKTMHVVAGSYDEQRWQNILNGGEVSPGVPKANNTLYRNALNGQYTCWTY